MNKNRFCITCLLYLSISVHLCLGQNRSYISDEVILMLPPSIPFSSLTSQFPLTHQRTLSPQLNIHLFKIHNNGEESLTQLCHRLMKQKEVIVAQANHYVGSRRSIQLFPDDSLFQEQWHLHNTGQTGGTPDADIDAPEAWDISTGGLTAHGDTLVVAVIDEGFDLSHPDINWRTNHGEIPGNGIDDDQNGYIDDANGWNAIDQSGILPQDVHGTHISGIISAKGNNTLGVSGITWNTQILPVLGFQPGGTVLKAESDVLAAYAYVYDMRKQYNESQGEKGAFIVATNTAFGVSNSRPEDHPIWCAVYDSLGSLGILNVVATSNNDINIDEQGDVPSACPSPYLIAVTSTGKNDQRSPRGYGPINVDLGAPGDSILSTGLNGSYRLLTGTSMSTPQVAGAVALMLSASPSSLLAAYKNEPATYALTYREILLNGVDTLSELKDITATGGRLNLHRATLNVGMLGDTFSSCSQPYFLSSTQKTDTSFFLSWKGEEDSFQVRIRPAGTSLWDSLTTDRLGLMVNKLEACTAYEVQLKSTCSQAKSIYSPTLLVKTEGCCEAPTPMGLFAVEEGISELRWRSVFGADSYQVAIRHPDSLSENFYTHSDTVLSLPDLEPCIDYAFSLRPFCPDTSGSNSEIFFFRSPGCGICIEGAYCESKGNTQPGATGSEWIDSVRIGGVDIASGDNGGYVNFTDSVSIPLLIDSHTPIRLVPGFSQSSFPESWRIWIDLNQNGDFEEAGELLWESERSSNNPLDDSLFIPSSAALGQTRMRISMRYLDPPPLCENFVNGEVEEYCVFLEGLTPSPDPLIREVWLFPNPVSEDLYIESSEVLMEINLWTMEGKWVRSWHPSSSYQIKAEVGDLAPGTYIVRIHNAQGTQQKLLIKN